VAEVGGRVKLFNHVIELHARARHPFTHFKVHRREYWTHVVWGKLSLIYGQPHLEPMTVCAHCSEEIQRVGEDYLDWCEGCQSLEGDTEEITAEEFERRHA
jgi:hypothetical protein